MRPTDNHTKSRRNRKPARPVRTESPFVISNQEIMADLMYGRGGEPVRRSGR